MIEITTSLVMLLSPFIPAAEADTVTTVPESREETAIVAYGKSVTLREYVEEYFKDAPILARIAECESNTRHYKPSGDVVRGKVNKYDVGIMQINELYHQERAESLGYDLESLDGNLAYAKFLYGKQGSAPWVHSSKCWKKYESKIASR